MEAHENARIPTGQSLRLPAGVLIFPWLNRLIRGGSAGIAKIRSLLRQRDPERLQAKICRCAIRRFSPCSAPAAHGRRKTQPENR